MFLIIIKGANVGSIFPLDKAGPIVIGRGKESDFQILDLMVSRTHCEIEKRDNGFYIKDLNSTNKTYVNEKVIEGIPKLEVGDIIGIGDTLLLFTDQKEIAIKSVEDYARMRMKQTGRIDLSPE